MEILLFILILLLIYLLNPLKDEEKVITTPFITVLYIISVSYVLSFLGIPMYKLLYILPLFIACIFYYKKYWKKNLNLIFSFNFTNSLKLRILLFIILISLIIGYFVLPKYPCEMWDSQFHMYKIKAIMLEKTIFYTNEEFKRYWSYPSGFHSFVYFLSIDFKEIPKTIYFIEFYTIVLFVLAHYYIGESLKEGLGLYTALFVPLNYEFYRILLKAIYPNTLGYSIFLILIAFLMNYRNSGDNIYLHLFSFGVFSLIFTHSFPFLMLVLFLISLILWEIIYKNYENIINYMKYFLISIVSSMVIIYSKLIREIINYSHVNNSKYISVVYIYKIIGVVILGGFGSASVISLYLDLISKPYGFYTILLLLMVSLIYIGLYIFGSIFLIKNKKGFFIFYCILMIFWLLNRYLFGLKIPFFSALYNYTRWFYNFQILMPLFYGCGLYYLSNRFLNNYKKYLIVGIILIILGYHAFVTYQKSPKFYWNFYLVGNEEIKVFNFINENNITNKLFLNFGQDAGQFIPIFTNNKCVFCYGNLNTFKNVTAKEIINYTWNYNYKEFVQFCKDNNIEYIFIPKNSSVNYKFFKNSSYFEKIYCKNNITILKVK
ncbi:hypothetical protein [Methanocaldococcus sp.]